MQRLSVNRSRPEDDRGEADTPRGGGARTVGAVRWTWAVTVAGGIGLYFTLAAPGPDLVYSILGALSVVLIIAGVRFFRPSSPVAWYLIAAGRASLVLADIVYYVYEPIVGAFPPYPSFIDAIYLSSYPLTAAGLLMLVGRRSPGRDGAALLDALVIATAGALLTWVFLIAPYATDAALTLPEKLVSIAYPCMDVLILGVAARLVVAAGARGPSFSMLVSCFALNLAADSVYGVMILAGTYNPGSLIDTGWLLSYGLLAAAALHPSMRNLSEPAPASNSRLTRGRLTALAIASLTAPVTLGVQSALGQPIQAPVFVGSCVVLFLLVLTRGWGLVREIEMKADRLEKQTDDLTRQGRVLQSSLEQREALEAQLKHLAFHDSLTGLANRALFDDRLQHAVARSTRSKESLAMLFLDLDGFKAVNDKLGHTAGDAVLVEVGCRLERCLRVTDTLARFGGDEFAILIEGDGTAGAASTKTRIEAVLREPLEVGHQEVRIEASIGIAVSPPGGTGAQLLAAADAAMYEAKNPLRVRV